MTGSNVYTSAQCRELDRIAIAEFGIPPLTLMRRAGRFASDLLIERWKNVKSIGIWCGSGNNAGDGYIVAGMLHNRGMKVSVRQIGNVDNLPSDAAAARVWMHEQGIEFCDNPIGQVDVAIDALLGIGTSGHLRGTYVNAVAEINSSNSHVLSLDIPTGIHADTGSSLTPTPVRADVTTTFVGRKIGLYTGIGADHAGSVHFSDLGIPSEAYERVEGIGVIPTCESEVRLPARTPASHKNLAGHVLVIGGNRNTGGAAILSAEGALRTGAGLVTVITQSVHVAPILSRLPEVMVCAYQLGDDISPFVERADVIVVGPGLGQDAWAVELLKQVFASGKPVVVDADGLNLLATGRFELPQLAILTPHPGEAARLLDVNNSDIAQDRVAAAKAISKRFDAIVVLKGAGTLVASQGEVHGICDQAIPALGTAGSGDVLSGVIGACHAQLQRGVNAASLGVWLHVLAGKRAVRETDGRAVTASDIANAVRPWG